MRSVTPNGREGVTFLERVLQLHGDFRRSLESIRVTPLQAGVLLFLRRRADAAAALAVSMPTLSVVVTGLVRKRWVVKRRTGQDRRAVSLRLSRQGETIEQRVCHVDEQARRA